MLAFAKSVFKKETVEPLWFPLSLAWGTKLHLIQVCKYHILYTVVLNITFVLLVTENWNWVSTSLWTCFLFTTTGDLRWPAINSPALTVSPSCTYWGYVPIRAHHGSEHRALTLDLLERERGRGGTASCSHAFTRFHVILWHWPVNLTQQHVPVAACTSQVIDLNILLTSDWKKKCSDWESLSLPSGVMPGAWFPSNLGQILLWFSCIACRGDWSIKQTKKINRRLEKRTKKEADVWCSCSVTVLAWNDSAVSCRITMPPSDVSVDLTHKGTVAAPQSEGLPAFPCSLYWAQPNRLKKK